GRGGTSTRGHKGAKSRSGYSRKRNFEGGQMPLQMRVPKRGFKNPNRVAYVPLNLNRLQAIADKFNLSEINMDTLVANGIVRKNDKVKVLGRGKLKAELSLNVHAISASAKSAVEKAGGSVNLVKPAQKASVSKQEVSKETVEAAPSAAVETATVAEVVTETVTEVVKGDDPEFDILMSDKVEESGTVVNVVKGEESTISEEEE
ncbi:MAG: 50S ribosomal protein L15, partial [Bacteroidota bacterium]